MHHYLMLLGGILCAGIGGELFVRGIVGVAHWARVPPGIIGATLAAFATSSPELSVALQSAWAGTPQLALGDALGSNVVNIALILGLTLLLAGLHCPRDTVKRDFPLTLLTQGVLGVLALDGVLSRVDGVLLLGMFCLWSGAVVRDARKRRSAADAVLGERRAGRAFLVCGVGLGLLLTAGRLIVTGATGIAAAFGVDAFVIGATLVAVGTSVPELATALVAQLRGHAEVGLGTILGSNIFNGLCIIGVAALITPIPFAWHDVAVALTIGFLAVAATFPTARGVIERWRGVVLLVLYAVYLTTMLQR
jgi:cation:H+ antiporter